MNNSVYISDVHYFLPGFEEKNSDLESEFPGRVDSGYINKIGIKSKRIISKEVKPSYLAFMAGQQLLEKTGFDKTKIDALIHCSFHHDYVIPPTSCVLHHELGLSSGAMTFDITHACSGYLYGLALAKSIIVGLNLKNVLFLTSSALTKYIDPANIALRLLIGDAGSATLISSDKIGVQGILGEFIFGTDGTGIEQIIIRDGLEANPLSETSKLEKMDQFGNIHTDAGMFMDGQSVFMFVLKNIPRIIADTLAKNNLQEKDIDLFILHQANYYVLETVRKKMKIDADRFFYSMEQTGNTVQATVPIALKEAFNQGKIVTGNKVLIAGFGTGLSWGATIITF